MRDDIDDEIFQIPQPALTERIAAASAAVTCCAANLGYLTESAPAQMRDKIRLIHHGVDLRGFQRCDLVAVLEEERAAYAELAAAGYSQQAIDRLDARQRQAAIVRIVDFGIAAAVVALSALGCVPVSSCRGNSLGARRHEHPAPMVTFYARRIHLAALGDAVQRADISIVNNAAKLEAYADDLRKMHAFAEALLPHIKA